MYDEERFRDPAERSYLGKYGLVGSAWTAWLIRRAPELLASEPASFQATRAPRCPFCSELMAYRPGEWVCYRLEHPDPVRVKMEIAWPRAPAGDVLNRLDQVLDYRYDVETGEYVILERTDIG